MRKPAIPQLTLIQEGLQEAREERVPIQSAIELVLLLGLWLFNLAQHHATYEDHEDRDYYEDRGYEYKLPCWETCVMWAQWELESLIK